MGISSASDFVASPLKKEQRDYINTVYVATCYHLKLTDFSLTPRPLVVRFNVYRRPQTILMIRQRFLRLPDHGLNLDVTPPIPRSLVLTEADNS